MSALQVKITEGRGLSADELTEMALNKIMSVSSTAPEPIRQQAEAFRENLAVVLKHYIVMAKQNAATDIYHALRMHGYAAAEDLLKLQREINKGQAG